MGIEARLCLLSSHFCFAKFMRCLEVLPLKLDLPWRDPVHAWQKRMRRLRRTALNCPAVVVTYFFWLTDLYRTCGPESGLPGSGVYTMRERSPHTPPQQPTTSTLYHQHQQHESRVSSCHVGHVTFLPIDQITCCCTHVPSLHSVPLHAA